MHKIDAPGATFDNLFTEGNPSLSIPATEVSDDWLNDVQEELVTVIEGAGIVLVKGQQDQLQTAIFNILGDGGSGAGQVINNSQGAPANISALLFDKAIYKAAVATIDIERLTDSGNTQATGELRITHNTNDNIWRVSRNTSFDISGVTFTITAAGQVQYISDTLAGASYVGRIRIVNINRIRQSL